MMRLDHLPNQQKNERVVLFLRRQWFAVLSIVAAFAILILVPAALAFVFWERLLVLLADPVIGPAVSLLASMYVLCVWLFAFMEFTDYCLDTWIITNERIINVEQHGLFNRTASELHLAAVQDITSELKGVIPTFFDYGNVFVQTAAERERFVFKNIEHPERVKELILKLVEEDKKRHASHLAAAVAEQSKSPIATSV